MMPPGTLYYLRSPAYLLEAHRREDQQGPGLVCPGMLGAYVQDSAAMEKKLIDFRDVVMYVSSICVYIVL